ncbi:MAG: ABC transporter ATP-binding protein [Crenarchaeota archaeon]|nr:ABC transporter ATP-binding protein [Thermoproteota archaeon]
MELVLRDVWAGYGSRSVLRGVSLHLRDFSLAAVIGPNGSGKTTLLRVVAGLIKPRRGEVIINGVRIDGASPRDRARIVSYVPQRDPVCELEVVEYVALGRYPHGGSIDRRSIEIARETLRELGIEHLASRRLSRLSGGELRLASIARALAQRSPLILLDEPLESLDPRNRAVVLRALRRATSMGHSIILTTHDLGVALTAPSIVVGIRDGRIAFVKAPAQISSRDLESLYGVEIEIVGDGCRRAAIAIGSR